MGPDYVRSMCHDIEDPTFDATAVASNPKAQVRPVHRPPRAPADRHPHCAWTVIIDESYPEVAPIPALADRRGQPRGRAGARTRSTPATRVRPTTPGRSSPTWTSRRSRAPRWCGSPTRCASRCTCWCSASGSRSAPARRRRSRRTRSPPGSWSASPGVAAERIHRALAPTPSPRWRLHPLLNPAAYVDASVADATVTVRRGPAHEDGGWIALCGPGSVRPLQAAVRGVDPHLDVEISGTAADWTATVVRRDEAGARSPRRSRSPGSARASGSSSSRAVRCRSLPCEPGTSQDCR